MVLESKFKEQQTGFREIQPKMLEEKGSMTKVAPMIYLHGCNLCQGQLRNSYLLKKTKDLAQPVVLENTFTVLKRDRTGQVTYIYCFLTGNSDGRKRS